MRYLAKAGFSQSYTYFTWRNTKQELERVLHRADPDRRARVHAAEPVRQHARHPARVSAARRPAGVPGRGWCWRRRSARATASTAASSCSRTCRSARAARSISTRRSTRSARATSRRPDSLAETDRARSTRSAASIRRCSSIAASSSTRPTTRSCSATASARPTAPIRSWSSSTSIPLNMQHGYIQLPLADWSIAARRDRRGARSARRAKPTCGAASGTTSASIRRIARRATSSPSPNRQSANRRSAIAVRLSPMSDPLWYKDAIIYEVHVRAFFDSNDDGIGDFAGPDRRSSTTSRTSASTRSGCCRSTRRRCATTATTSPTTRASIRATARSRTSTSSSTRRTSAASGSSPSWSSTTPPTSIRGSRRRGARPAGSPERDFYVWSDTNQKYQGVRIIFTDTETSNWTWDDTAKAYYWHRFFHHQPDLNFDNPRGARRGRQDDAVLARSRGRRAAARRGAVPDRARRHELREPRRRRTTSSRRSAARWTTRYPDRMLLAEANQWPADVRAVLRRRRRVPHGVPLPADAAHVHGAAAGRPPSDRRDHAADARHSRELPVGDCSCATTTS